jgi:hypothetical protein
MIQIFLLLMLTCYGCSNSRQDVLQYLSILRNYDVKDASLARLQVDPSYKRPYNVYIKVSLDKSSLKQLIEDLGLVTKEQADTIKMRSEMFIDEAALYFTMSSVNKSRLPHLENKEKSIGWWPQNFKGPVYAASYIDSGSERKPVRFDQRKNGRIAAAIKGSTIYFLIECWG